MVIEEKYMRRALQLARLGYGWVSPNPMVGAVLVSCGRIIGEGYHRKWGEGHAEVNAIASVKAEDQSLIKDATLYVTLEPCSHYGKTPPCSKLIIDKQIPRVVVGSLDPFKEVSGRGVAMLREAGVEVTCGILEDECRELNCKFIMAHTLRRPYILLKWAETADRKIDKIRSINNSHSLKISTASNIVLVHRLRAGYDAIMVGNGTLRSDNPSLTVRRWAGRNPQRVVLTHRGCADITDAKMFTDGNRTLVLSDSGKTMNKEKTNAEELVVPNKNDSIASVLQLLYERGITSLMVEGGAMVLNHMIADNLWDEIRIERAPWIIGEGVDAPSLPNATTWNEDVDGHTIIKMRRSDFRLCVTV